jgi:hypothetical protein
VIPGYDVSVRNPERAATTTTTPCVSTFELLTQNDQRTITMDDTALEPLENALAEWEGHNIKLSVNESPELDELVDIDLAQCLGKADGARFPHRKLSAPEVDEKVRDFRKKYIFALHTVPKFDTLTFRHSDISPK